MAKDSKNAFKRLANKFAVAFRRNSIDKNDSEVLALNDNSEIKAATREQLLNLISDFLVEKFRQANIDPEILWLNRKGANLETLSKQINFGLTVEDIQQHLAQKIVDNTVVIDVPVYISRDYWYIYSLITVALQKAVLDYLNYSAVKEAQS